MRSLIFWDVTLRRFLVSYRRFGTTSWFYLQRSSSSLKTEQTLCH